jgi:hypothetical protein
MILIKAAIIALLIYALYKAGWYGLMQFCRKIDK